MEIEQLRTLIADGLTGTANDGIMDSGSAQMLFLLASTEYTIPLDEDVQSLEYIAQDVAVSTLQISFVIRDR